MLRTLRAENTALRAENTALRAWVGGDPVALAFLQMHRTPTTTCGSTE